MVSKTIDVGSIPTAPVIMTRESMLAGFFLHKPVNTGALRSGKRIPMKKAAALFILTCSLALPLSACGEERPLLTATDYELDAETAQTIRGVKIGDGSDAFLAAYRDYDILSSVDGDSYQFLPAEEIPFDKSLTTILPSFFVDGAAVEIDSFCENNGIEEDALLSFLTDEAYLDHHAVVYQYLVFEWENGAITDIRSESMDYNKDASYYNSSAFGFPVMESAIPSRPTARADSHLAKFTHSYGLCSKCKVLN